MRPGYLPSSHFARPADNAGVNRPVPSNQPRPGVSYIPSAESDRARNQPATLPQTPRFERAPAGEPPQDNAQRFQRENAAPRPAEVQQPRNVEPQQGYQGPQHGYEQPRGNQPQQPRPAQNGEKPHESSEHHPPPRKDDQQR